MTESELRSFLSGALSTVTWSTSDFDWQLSEQPKQTEPIGQTDQGSLESNLTGERWKNTNTNFVFKYIEQLTVADVRRLFVWF